MYNLVCCRCGRTYESDRELGIYCPICQALEKAEIAAREARTITRGVEYGEFFREDSVFCPHCGREMDPGDDCDLYNEGDHERKCGCGKVFLIETEYSIKFSTRKPDDEEDGDAKDS